MWSERYRLSPQAPFCLLARLPISPNRCGRGGLEPWDPQSRMNGGCTLSLGTPGLGPAFGDALEGTPRPAL